MKASLSMKSYP